MPQKGPFTEYYCSKTGMICEYKISGIKVKTMILHWQVRESQPYLTELKNHLIIFFSADQFLDMFLELQFLLCMSSRYLLKCITNLTSLFFKIYQQNPKYHRFFQNRVSSHQICQCAMASSVYPLFVCSEHGGTPGRGISQFPLYYLRV